MLLDHKGRISGKNRQTVLEVVKHDKSSGTFYIASGFGEGSDWVLNIESHPEVVFQAGGRTFTGIARRLSRDQAQEIILEYGKLHPIAIRELARFMGYHIKNSEEDLRELGGMLPIFSLTPVPKTKK